MDYPVIIWLVLTILFLVAEAATAGLITIWLIPGSVVALLLALCHLPVPIQLVAFFLLSAVALILTRRYAADRRPPKKIPTNADRLLGKAGMVEQAIDNAAAQGRVQVQGEDWSARSQSGEPIPQGTPVRVLAIEGVKLIVAPIGCERPQ